MSGEPGAKFLRWALHYVPADAKPEIVLAFALATEEGAGNAIDAFISICRDFNAGYARKHAASPRVTKLLERMSAAKPAESDEARPIIADAGASGETEAKA